MRKRIFTLMGGLLIAATTSISLFAEDTSPQQAPQATADDIVENSNLATGFHRHGSWTLYKDDYGNLEWWREGRLEIAIKDGNQSLCNYDMCRGVTTAPWGSYAGEITSVCVYSKEKKINRFGAQAFTGIVIEEFATPREKEYHDGFAEVEDLGYGCFEQAVLPQQATLPSVKTVGAMAFAGVHGNVITLPSVVTVGEDAFDEYGTSIMSDRRHSTIEYIDLGKNVTTIKAGAFNTPSLWKYDDSPSLFIQSPTPPDWQRLYERDAFDVFSGVGHYYEYPFGDKPGTLHAKYETVLGDYRASSLNESSENCKVIVVVPEAYWLTYCDFYHQNHPEVDYGYMSAYYVDGDHKKSGQYASCGRIFRGEPIYEDNTMIGWYYIDDDARLHIGTTDPEKPLPAYTSANAPWKSWLGEYCTRAVLHMSKIAENAFSNGALDGIDYIYIAADSLEIGSNAFSGNTSLKYMDTYWGAGEIPVKIGEKAFYNCSALSALSRNLKTISLGESAFENCAKLMQPSSIEAKDIPVKAFKGCKMLQTGYINFGVMEKIDHQAFEGCNSGYFKQMKFGKNLKSIGGDSFKGCTSLTDIYVESAVVPAAPSTAFSGVMLSQITLHVEGSKYPGYSQHPVWGEMKVDKDKVLPVGGPGYGWSLSSEGILVVYKSTANYASCTDQPWYPYREFITNIIIENGITYISENEFAFPGPGESHVGSVSIPRSCKSIRDNAFRHNDQLQTIYISSVENIGDRAFFGCSNLEIIELGENLKQAGNFVFQGCVKLEKMYDYTLEAAQVGYDFLTGVRDPLYGTSAPARAPKAQAEKGDMPTLYVQDAALCNYLVANGWKDLNFGNTTEHGTIVDNGKFGDGHYILWSDGTLVCSSSNGSDVTLSSAQRTQWKNNVKRIEVIGELTELGNVFQDLSNLEFVALCESVKKLNTTFANCPKLETINLDNVESVGFKCFSNCANLHNAVMPRAKEIGQNAFENTSSLEVVQAGEGCVINYQAFKNSAVRAIDLAGSDLANANAAFDGCNNLKYVAYNGAVVAAGTFKNCTALKTVYLGENVEAVLSKAFEGCTALDSIYSSCPTPPVVAEADEVFKNLTLSEIHLIVPEAYERPYWDAPVWKDMNIGYDKRPAYADLSYPIYIPLGKEGKGTAVIYSYSDGKPMTIDYDGTLPEEAHAQIDRFMPLNERAIVISDNVTAIPAAKNNGMTTHVTASEYLQIGANVKSIGTYALYNNFWNGDNFYIDCYAPVPPTLTATSFNYSLMDEKVGEYGIKEREKVNLYILDDDAVYEKYIHAPYYHYFNIIRSLAPSGAPQLVTVTFVDWDDSRIDEVTVEWGGHAAFPADPVRKGYVFKGWSTTDLNNVKEDITVKAQYYEDMFTVRFFDWDNTLIKEEQVLYGHSATAPEDPVREGYIFTGWGAGWFNVMNNLDIYASYIVEGSQGVEDVQADEQISSKFIYDGQMYIRRGNAIYTIQGQRVK